MHASSAYSFFIQSYVCEFTSADTKKITSYIFAVIVWIYYTVTT